MGEKVLTYDELYDQKKNEPVWTPDPLQGIDLQEKTMSLDLVSLDTIEETEIEWLIPGYIVKDTVNFIFGDGGSGKTSAWCAIAGAISSGKACFLEGFTPLAKERKAGTVLCFSSEDQLSKSLHKRLRKSKADMTKIFSMPLSDKRFTGIKFASDYLEELIKKYKPVLIIFDPIQSFIPPDINMSSRNAMRQCCQSLIGWGEAYKVTSLVICHSNKRSGVSGRERMSDSTDLWDIARNVLAVGSVPDSDLRYISQEKISDYRGSQTVLFKIVDSIPVFHSYTDHKDRFYQQEKQKNIPSPKKDDCKELIITHLQKAHAPVLAKDLDEYLKANSISQASIERAKTELRKERRIIFVKEDKPHGRWLVSHASGKDEEV